VADQVFQQFATQYEQARKDAEGQAQGQSLATLGLDPRKWLVDPQNAGEAQVGDTDTVKITAGIDVGKLLDDANTALEAAATLGAAQGAGQIPEKLTEAQKQQAIEAIKDPKIEIYTGADDKIMRRLLLTLGIADKGTDTTGTVSFDVAITDLNEPQEISAPENAQPFDQLLGQLGALGALGGGGGAGSGSGSGSGGGQGGGGQAGGDFEAYSECLTKAGDDVAKARECADLLAP
jgi:hypothetical protein